MVIIGITVGRYSGMKRMSSKFSKGFTYSGCEGRIGMPVQHEECMCNDVGMVRVFG